jgi:hypothetical protein
MLKNLSELGSLVTNQVVQPGAELKVLLNIGSYDLSLKGQVRHADPQAGIGIDLMRFARETAKSCSSCCGSFSEKSSKTRYVLNCRRKSLATV